MKSKLAQTFYIAKCIKKYNKIGSNFEAMVQGILQKFGVFQMSYGRIFHKIFLQKRRIPQFYKLSDTYTCYYVVELLKDFDQV